MRPGNAPAAARGAESARVRPGSRPRGPTRTAAGGQRGNAQRKGPTCRSRLRVPPSAPRRRSARSVGQISGPCWRCCSPKSCLTLETPGTVARQAPLPIGFPRQRFWSRLLLPSPEDLPDPGIEPMSPALRADSLPLNQLGSPSMGPTHRLNLQNSH